MPKPIFEKFEHVAINVNQIERAKAFYGGVLGLREVDRPESFNFPGAWYRLGNADLHLIERPVTDPSNAQHFALWVNDLHAAAEQLEKAGHVVAWEKMKIQNVDRFFTRDPDGNRIEIMSADGR